MRNTLLALLALVTFVPNAIGNAFTYPTFQIDENQQFNGIAKLEDGGVQVIFSKYDPETYEVTYIFGLSFNSELEPIEGLAIQVPEWPHGEKLTLGEGALQGGHILGYLRIPGKLRGRTVIWDTTTFEKTEPDPNLGITHIDNDGVINGDNRFSSPEINVDLEALTEGLLFPFVWASPNAELFIGLGDVSPIQLVFRTSPEQEWTKINPIDRTKFVSTTSIPDEFAILWLEPPGHALDEVPTLHFFEPQSNTTTPVEVVTGDPLTHDGVVIGDRYYWISDRTLSYLPLEEVMYDITPKPEGYSEIETPPITLDRSENSIILSWTSDTELRLEGSSDFVRWEKINYTPSNNGSETVRIPTDSEHAFFRLVP